MLPSVTLAVTQVRPKAAYPNEDGKFKETILLPWPFS